MSDQHGVIAQAAAIVDAHWKAQDTTAKAAEPPAYTIIMLGSWFSLYAYENGAFEGRRAYFGQSFTEAITTAGEHAKAQGGYQTIVWNKVGGAAWEGQAVA